MAQELLATLQNLTEAVKADTAEFDQRTAELSEEFRQVEARMMEIRRRRKMIAKEFIANGDYEALDDMWEWLNEPYPYVKMTLEEEQRRVAAVTADQPAGTPTLIDKPHLCLVHAPRYLDQKGTDERKKKRIAKIRERKRRFKAGEDIGLPKLGPRSIDWKQHWIMSGRQQWRDRNHWYSKRLNALVVVEENLITGKARPRIYRMDDQDAKDVNSKAEMYFNTYEAAGVYTLKAEAKAMELLKSKTTEEQYAKYVLTGMVIEQSKKSGLHYIFRRLRPTLVFRKTEDTYKYITALCAHPVGYYGFSWAGTLTPTDDIVAHLLYMRGDEYRYWKKSSKHPRKNMQADF